MKSFEYRSTFSPEELESLSQNFYNENIDFEKAAIFSIGIILLAFATSEPMAGSDVAGLQCQARIEGDEIILKGRKMWITNGPTADVLVVYAKTDPEKGHKGISTFLIEKGMKGFSVA